MPAFDLRFIGAAEDMPGCLVSLDARTVRGDVKLLLGAVAEIVNRGPASYRRYQNGDAVHTTWWNAVAQGASAVNAAAFAGAGGVDVAAGAGFELTTTAALPAFAAGEFTVVAIVDGTFTGAAQKFVYSDAGGIVVKLNNGSGNVGWSDAGGGGSGAATINGPQLHIVRFGKATPLASPTMDWRRNCAPLSSGAYTPTNFVGGSVKAFGGPTTFTGTAGRLLVFSRRLTDTEVAWLENVLPPLFGLLPALERFVAPETRDWLDPPDGSRPSRINASAGHSMRAIEVPLRGTVSVLVEAVESAGAGNELVLSTATGYVPWYVEWPFVGGAMEPLIVPDAAVPGVCKLPLSRVGHYMVGLYRPGSGAVFAHFDVVPE